MSFDVRYGKQRLLPRVGESLCKVYAHQKRAQKPCAVSYGNRVYIVLCHMRLLECFFYDVFYCQRMISARDFGNDAAESTVYFYLRGNHV